MTKKPISRNTSFNKFISIKGAKEHNLKNINLDIPKNTITVFTGLSGSGKSSLAFDIIYAEGQRRYVESLSAYARQFLETFDKPDVDSIEGLSPAISIEQKTTSKNPRSTVGTITEIYDYLRILFARVGVAYSPTTGLPIEKQSIPTMINKILEFPLNTKFYIYAPIVRGRKGEYKKEIEDLAKKGFSRLKINDVVYEIENTPKLDKNIKHNIYVLVDRLVAKDSQDKDYKTRLSQSLETTLALSNGLAIIQKLDSANKETDEEILFSEKLSCPVSGFSIEEIEPRLFSFNNPYGACHTCNGLGVEQLFAEHLIIPDETKSVIEAIAPWNTAMGGFYYSSLIESICKHYKVDPKTPYLKLSKSFKNILLYGSNDEKISMTIKTQKMDHTSHKAFEGIIPSLIRRYKETDSDSSRDNLTNYMVEKICTTCKGARLNEKALAIKITQKTISQICDLSVKNCLAWILDLNNHLNEQHKQIANKVIKEVSERLTFLNNVGIGYLSLSRKAGTISGGESQRIRLASQIGSGLSGVLYVLDEPSIGLHQRDNDKLIETLKHLRDLDNTLIVVEHDEDTIKAADFIVDIGPRAGIHGGEIVAQGSLDDILNNKNSLTGQYLSGKKSIAVPKKRRKGNGLFLEVVGAKGNNLKNLSVKFPLGVITCVSGVSGSGKSTLVNETLYKAVSQHLYNSKDDPLKYTNIYGIENIDKVIDIDQSPIGRMPSSNPATYVKVFDVIRELFASTNEAKALGYKSGRFSFNVKGGRCENCSGDGVIKTEMSFLPAVYVKCDICKGKRYNDETLEIRYKGKNIADILDSTVLEAVEFFANIPSIYSKLNALNNVGLGYIKLGQSAITLSGGEAQRVKLAKELAKRSSGKTLYILDEPTTGLHFEDINNLLGIIQSLVDQGNTAIIIEHNLDVIKIADYIIDFGPEGGEGGGTVIAKGTPEEIVKQNKGYTAQYLAKYLK